MMISLKSGSATPPAVRSVGCQLYAFSSSRVKTLMDVVGTPSPVVPSLSLTQPFCRAVHRPVATPPSDVKFQDCSWPDCGFQPMNCTPESTVPSGCFTVYFRSTNFLFATQLQTDSMSEP